MWPPALLPDTRLMKSRVVWVLVIVGTIFALAPLPGLASVRQPMAWSGCRQQVGVFPAGAEDAAAHLPAGYSPVAFQDSSPAGATSLPAPPGATAAVQLTATTCADDGKAPVTVAQLWVYVDPPAEMEADGVDAYVVVLWAAASTRGTAQYLAWAGLPAVHAAATNELDAAGMVRLGKAQIGANARVSTVVPAGPEDARSERLRLIGVRDQVVLGTVDFVEERHVHLLGAAELELGPTMPLRTPRTSGVGIHVSEPYVLTWVPVRS